MTTADKIIEALEQLVEAIQFEDGGNWWEDFDNGYFRGVTAALNIAKSVKEGF